MAGSNVDNPATGGIMAQLAEWLRVLVWPAVVLIFLILYLGPLSNLINRTQNLEISKDQNDNYKVALIAANLGAAEAKVPNSTWGPGKLNAVVLSATRWANEPALNDARVLWVDDNPDNNVAVRQALETLGIGFDLVRSTTEATEKLAHRRYNVVISDFERGDDQQGGYNLLEKVKQLNNPPPFILYTTSASPEHVKDAKDRGVYAETDSPQRLYNLVVQAILQKK